MPMLLREMISDVAEIMRNTIEGLIWNCTHEVFEDFVWSLQVHYLVWL